MSWGLVKGAEFTGKAIQKGASKLRERIQPEEKPVEVSPAVTRGLHIAKQATGGAAKVSQFLGEVTSIALLLLGSVSGDLSVQVNLTAHSGGLTLSSFTLLLTVGSVGPAHQPRRAQPF